MSDKIISMLEALKFELTEIGDMPWCCETVDNIIDALDDNPSDQPSAHEIWVEQSTLNCFAEFPDEYSKLSCGVILPYILKSTHEKTVQENIRLREAVRDLALDLNRYAGYNANRTNLEKHAEIIALAVGEKGNG